MRCTAANVGVRFEPRPRWPMDNGQHDRCQRTGRLHPTIKFVEAGGIYRSFEPTRAAFLASSFLAEHDEYLLWGHGSTGRTLAAELRRYGKRPSHIVEVHPRRLGQRIHGAPVVSPRKLGGLLPRRLVVSVSGAGPRARIRAALAELKLQEGRDFVCAA